MNQAPPSPPHSNLKRPLSGGAKLKVLGWVVSIGCVAILARSVDWSQALAAMRKLAPARIMALVAIYLVSYLIRGARCKILLPLLSFSNSISAVFVGFASNNILPARLGEVVRSQFIKNRTGIPLATALASVAVERIFDGVVLVLLLALGSASLDLPPAAETARWMGELLFGSALLGFLGVAYMTKTLRKLLPSSGKLGEIGASFLTGLELAARSPYALVGLLLLSVMVWLNEALMFYYCFHIFELALSFRAACTVLGIVNLGILIPSSPGYVGVFHSCVVLGLGIFGVPIGEALAYAIVVHLAQYLPVTLIGLGIFAKFGFSPRGDGRDKATNNPK